MPTSLVPYLYTLLIIFALVAGVMLPIQASVNAQLSNVLGNPFIVTLITFVVGTVVLFLFLLGGKTQWPTMADIHQTSWYMWLGGIVGVVYVAATIILAQRLGAATMIGLLITGQIMASLILDHFGWLGLPVHGLNLGRLIGAILLLLGVFLIQRF